MQLSQAVAASHWDATWLVGCVESEIRGILLFGGLK